MRSMAPGLVSRDGWALVDDAGNALLDTNDATWQWRIPRKDDGSYVDWFFFAHGQDYKQAVRGS